MTEAVLGLPHEHAESSTWRGLARSDIRVAADQLAAAHAWYGRWFAVHSLVPAPTYLPGDETFHLLPKDSPRDPGHSLLALRVPDALRVATTLLGAGARLSYHVIEWERRLQVECVDAFGTCWRLVQDAPDIDAVRDDIRRFAIAQRAAIQRLGGLGNVGRGVPFVGLLPFDETQPTLACATHAPQALGAPHYEEYDGWRTTGEPWFYWAFRHDAGLVLLQFSSTAKCGLLWSDLDDPVDALDALGLPADEWVDARRSASRFRVMRQDDNGNVFEVEVVESEWAARRRVAKLEDLGHKQHYWFEQVPMTDGA